MSKPDIVIPVFTELTHDELQAILATHPDPKPALSKRKLTHAERIEKLRTLGYLTKHPYKEEE